MVWISQLNTVEKNKILYYCMMVVFKNYAYLNRVRNTEVLIASQSNSNLIVGVLGIYERENQISLTY
jgi:hypothetical protein